MPPAAGRGGPGPAPTPSRLQGRRGAPGSPQGREPLPAEPPSIPELRPAAARHLQLGGDETPRVHVRSGTRRTPAVGAQRPDSGRRKPVPPRGRWPRGG